jgi:starvation-inducible DNA-binding protein
MQSTATINRAVPGLDATVRDGLVDGLNRSLAGLTDLAAAYKQAHWNVIGSDFSQLHQLFDEFAAQTREYMDLIAERAVALGGIARGTLQAAARETSLVPFPLEERDQRVLLQELLGRIDQMDGQLREVMNEAEREIVTQDLYIGIVRGIEKQRWMLQAHLAGYSSSDGGQH